MPVIWNMPAQWLRNKRDIIRTGQARMQGVRGIQSSNPPPPPLGSENLFFFFFFFFLLVRKVGDVWSDWWVPLLCVWKIDPKFWGQKKKCRSSPLPISFFRPGALSTLNPPPPPRKKILRTPLDEGMRHAGIDEARSYHTHWMKQPGFISSAEYPEVVKQEDQITFATTIAFIFESN